MVLVCVLSARIRFSSTFVASSLLCSSAGGVSLGTLMFVSATSPSYSVAHVQLCLRYFHLLILSIFMPATVAANQWCITLCLRSDLANGKQRMYTQY